MPYLGELAALTTSLLWACGATIITFASRRVGPQPVNAVRLWIAFLCLSAIQLLAFGRLIPTGASGSQMAWLFLSGVVGFAVGDALLLESFVRIGPRLSMLLMTLSPIFSAVLGGTFLNQTLGAMKLIAIAVTIGGIAVVVSERGQESMQAQARRIGLGVSLAAVGALANSFGLLFSVYGLAGGCHPVSATVVRVLGGALVSSLWLLARRELVSGLRGFRDRRAALLVLVSTLLGTVGGVTLSLVAIAHASLGVAATLMGLAPVFMLPLAVVAFKERVSVRSVLGTVLSLLGAAGLFLL